MIIKISKDDIEKLVHQDVITSDQSQKIWDNLTSAKHTEAQFNLTHFLYFFGGVICILAMSWFASEGWEQFGGAGLTIILLIYMIVFTMAGNTLWQREEFKIPGGLTYTIAVCMAPLLIYGIQRWTGFWVVKDNVAVTYRDYHELIRGSFCEELSTSRKKVVSSSEWISQYFAQDDSQTMYKANCYSTF